MNKYQILRIKYPGLLAIKHYLWIPFIEKNEKFAFLIASHSKGLTIHDPNNHLIQEGESGYRLYKKIDNPKKNNVSYLPTGENLDIKFHSLLEVNPFESKTYYEKPYTEILLLLNHQNKVSLPELSKYIQKLFVRYNTTILKSSLLNPKEDYRDESIVVLETFIDSEDNFEVFIKKKFQSSLEFHPSLIFLSHSKYGILPPKNEFIDKQEDLTGIPEEFFDVFEIFANGVMLLNHFKNYKSALLEVFISLEILIVRITNEVKNHNGISKRKLDKYKVDLNIAYIMEIELKLMFPFTEKESELLSQMNRARKIRNEIMHLNKIAEEDEIRELTNHIREFMFLLIDKYHLLLKK